MCIRDRDEAIQQVRGQVCGWVVDLRPSTGGGVVPGFVGLSSLLPDGPVIAFVDRDGVAGSGYSLAGSTLTVAPSAIVPDIEVPYPPFPRVPPVSYTHLRAHETVLDLVCRLLLEKKKKQKNN